jgi:hypothetical protein
MAFPAPRPGLTDNIVSRDDVDQQVIESFGFKDAERVLIEDLFNYTLPDFQGDDQSPT